MKIRILAIITIFSLFGCGENSLPTETDGSKTPISPAADRPEADVELKNLGFILPNQRIAEVDFTLKDLTGQDRSLGSFLGRVVMLNFWAVWCYACKVEMPSMQRFYDRFKAEGLEIVAVNVRESAETAGNYIKANKHTFPVLLDKSMEAVNLYGVQAFPTTFIIDRRGYLRAMAVGALNWDKPEVAAVFQKLLDER